MVTCPSCSGVFRAAESAAGKKAKCPSCGETIAIAGGEAAGEVVDAEEIATDRDGLPSAAAASGEDRKPCPMCGEMILTGAVKCRFCGEVLDKSMAGILGGSNGNARDPRWKQVRSGLALLYYSVIAVLLSGILMLVTAATFGAILGGRKGGDPPAEFMAIFLLFGLVVLGAGIAMLIGYGRCANVPPESGARGFALGSIVCLVANVLLSMLSGATKIEALNAFGSCIAIVGWVLFILFIRTSATFLGNDELAASAKRFLVLGGVFLASSFALGLLAAVGHTLAVAIIGLCVLVMMVVALVWYLRLIQGLIKTIDERTEQG